MKRYFLAILITLFLPRIAFAYTDATISADTIRFSNDTFVAGEDIRIYAKVRNLGDTDISGYVYFYSGTDPIGPSQIISIPVGGVVEEVWVDFEIPYGDFNIRAELKGMEPQDENADNNVALTSLYSPIFDEDGDGVEDDTDNCVEDYNPDQTDTDGDNAGDACDTDDDNDTLKDDVEAELGTDPTNPDTDGDQINDAQDADPLNAEIQAETQVNEDTAVEEQATESTSSDPAPADQGSANEEKKQKAEMLDIEEVPVEQILEIDQTENTTGIYISSHAQFAYQQNNWRSYTFRALTRETEGQVLSWDFNGNGASSQYIVDYQFPGAGTYTVTLQIANQDGEVVTEEQEIRISFLHLGNPIVLIFLGLCILFAIIGIIGEVYWAKRLRGMKQSIKTESASVTAQDAEDDHDTEREMEEVEESVNQPPPIPENMESGPLAVTMKLDADEKSNVNSASKKRVVKKKAIATNKKKASAKLKKKKSV